MHTRSKQHETEFKPASGFRTLTNSSYTYIEQNPETKKKIKKDENGKVKTEPKNFTTNPMSRVDQEVFKQLKHMEDPYSRKREMEKMEQEANNSKLPKEVPPFRSTVYGDRPLVKDLFTYGLDDKTKKMMAERKVRAKTLGNFVHHEAPFRPVVKYPGGTLCEFPKHMADKPQEKVPRKQEGKEKEKWKSNNWGLTRPTPSIILNPKNIHLRR
jgi:hypothetical protein